MIEDFAAGFADAAAMRGYPEGVNWRKLSKAYIKGHATGTEAWRKAIDEYREEIGHHLTTEIGD